MNKDMIYILWELPLLLMSQTESKKQKQINVYKTLVAVFIYTYWFQKSYQGPVPSNKIFCKRAPLMGD